MASDTPTPAPRSLWRRVLGYPGFLVRQVRVWGGDLWFLALATLLAIVFLMPYMIYSVPPGSVGVEWKRFMGGTVTDKVYPEGTRFILPWDKLYLYDVRIQSGENLVSALSADGLKVEVDLSWIFFLLPQTAGIVHKGVGPDYRDKLIVQVIESVVRDKISLVRSEELHSPERAIFEKNVFAGVKAALDRYDAINRLDPNYTAVEGDVLSLDRGVTWVNLESVLIKEIRFPIEVQEAYIRKNTARALVDEYNFRVAAEQKEVERKMIEALGIRNFQEVVNQGLTDSYLRWKTLEAYVATSRALAQSPNAKLVVMGPGTGVGGMPMILNTNALDGMGADPKAPGAGSGAGAAAGSGAGTPNPAASASPTNRAGSPASSAAPALPGTPAPGRSDAGVGRPLSSMQLLDSFLQGQQPAEPAGALAEPSPLAAR